MRSTFLLFAAGILAATGCGDSTPRSPLADKVGQSCTVRFRRGDALGAAGDLAVSPTTDSSNGVELNVWGELVAADGGWVTVVQENREFNIPNEAILLVEFTRKPEPAK